MSLAKSFRYSTSTTQNINKSKNYLPKKIAKKKTTTAHNKQCCSCSTNMSPCDIYYSYLLFFLFPSLHIFLTYINPWFLSLTLFCHHNLKILFFWLIQLILLECRQRNNINHVGISICVHTMLVHHRRSGNRMQIDLKKKEVGLISHAILILIVT